MEIVSKGVRKEALPGTSAEMLRRFRTFRRSPFCPTKNFVDRKNVQRLGILRRR
jgi:hypothetical protein